MRFGFRRNYMGTLSISEVFETTLEKVRRDYYNFKFS